MATAAGTKSHWSHCLKDHYTVTVRIGEPDIDDANVILECFETDRQIHVLKTSRTSNGVFHVQFPVPAEHLTQSTEMLRESVTYCIRMHSGLKCIKFALSYYDKIKTWKTKKLIEEMLASFCETVDSDLTTYSGAVLVFCSVDNKNFDSTVRACEKYFKSVEGEQHKEQTGNCTKGVTGMQDAVITVKKGRLDSTKADMLACTMSPSLDLTQGAVSNALLQKTGAQLQKDLRKQFANRMPFGEIAMLNGYNLPCKYLALGVMLPIKEDVLQDYESENDYYRCSIHEFMVKCLNKADEYKCTSIAFPAIGSGNLMYPLDVVADEMFATTYNWLYDNRDSFLQKILFVIYNKDEETFEVFKTSQQQYEKEEIKASQRKYFKENTIDLSRDIQSPGGQESKQLKKKCVVTKENEQGNSLYSGNSNGKQKIKTHKVHVQNPDENMSEVVDLPSEDMVTLIQFFYSKTLSTYKSNGCDITFIEGQAYISGKTGDVSFAVNDLKKACNELNKLSTDILSLPTNWNKQKLNSELIAIGKDHDVCCIINKNKKDISFLGKSLNAVISAKNRMKKFFEKIPMMALKPLPSDKMKNVVECKTREGLVVKVYKDDLLTAPVDCIVNAANANLEHGGGIAKSIAKSAGKELTQEGIQYLKKHGKLQVGEACYTGAGKLPFELVIHVVGPCWSDYAPHSREKVCKCEEDLRTAVLNSLILAEKCGMTTIAIPAISSGIFGCPVELCCVQYVKGVISYSHLSGSPLKEIHLVDTNTSLIDKIKQTFKEMIPDGDNPAWYNVTDYIKKETARGKKKQTGDKQPYARDMKMHEDDPLNQVRSQHHLKPTESISKVNEDSFKFPFECTEQPPGLKKKVFTCHFGPSQKLYVYSGDLFTLQNIKMLACGEMPNGEAKGLSEKITAQAGIKFKKEKKEKFQNQVKSGVVIVCKGHQSNFDHIAHAVLKWDARKDEERKQQSVGAIFIEILEKMKHYQCHSLALPLLGTGNGKGDPKTCTKILMESLSMFSSMNNRYRFSIHLVHIEKEKTEAAIQVIKEKLKTTAGAIPKTSVQRSKSFHELKMKGEPRSGSSTKEMHKTNQARSTKARKDSPNFPDTHRKPIQARCSLKPSPETRLSENWTISERNLTDLCEHKSKSQREYDHENVTFENDNINNKQSIAEAMEQDADGNDSGNNYSNDEEEFHDERTSLHESSDNFNSSSAVENPSEEVEICVICMEEILNPKTLPCGHIFCSKCIEEQFTYKEVCPTCGKVCGVITGDQPEGTMSIKTSRDSCAGYEDYGRFEITYRFSTGVQGSEHPTPGKMYKGITRTAYLPNSKQGKVILEMLKVAFDRKIVFTIGRSRTTGEDGVITWNDIHHKTDPKPNTQFGYPDSTYLDRVTEELKVKGVTVNDIHTLSAPRIRRRKTIY